MHDTDEEHEHPAFEIGPGVVLEDVEGLEMFTLKSVGIGSSISHPIFSQLTSRREGAAWPSRHTSFLS